MKKLMFFLMVAIPILVILIVKLTANVAVGNVFISVQRIQVDSKSVERKVGDSVDLSYTIYPQNATNKDVIWSSSNELAATVDTNGHVEFVGIGSGYISATTVDGNMRSQCSFYVWDSKVHQVKLSSPQNYVHINKTLQLSATVLPNEADNKEVIFSSSDESIAKVDTNGVVSGLAIGYVKITATSVDGYYSDFVNLSVIKPVTSLNVKEKEIVTSLQSEQIQYLIEPDDATNKSVQFIVDNPEIAEVNHLGVIKFKKIGQVNVTLITEDGNFQQNIKYYYTGGYAYDLILTTNTIDLNIDSAPLLIEYKTEPSYLSQTKVEFSSDNENIAFVDANGYLHAVKGGSTVIRVKVKKNEREMIEEQIYVNIESPAQAILIDDGITAENLYTLNPKSLPEDSTNTLFFYHSQDQAKAEVDEDGLVTFKTTQPYTAVITIYANEDNSDVYKTVRVTYTAGRASSYELIDKEITLQYGQSTTLNYSFEPENATIKQVTMSIEENISSASEDVVEILEDGRICGTAGGKAIINVKFLLYDGSYQEEKLEVVVLRMPTLIEINLDLEYYKSQYITSQNIVSFSGNVLPIDATDREIKWSVNDKNVAFIIDNNLIFNQSGRVTLTANIGEISNSVEVYYVGTNPVYAEVKAVKEGERMDIPEVIMAGESFEVEISDILPKFSVNPPISLQATNQKTIHQSGKALQVSGNTVTGYAGGTATLVVYISSSIRLNYPITVIRKPESISVIGANSQTTANSFNLICEVLPYDTTNQNVRFEVEESDVAYVENSVLYFKENGVANIRAISEEDENIKFDFYIEKIEKNMVIISVDQTETTVNKGDLITFNIGNIQDIIIENSFPIVDGETVVQKENKYLRACNGGKVEVKVVTSQHTYTFEITVNQPVEEIILTSDIDKYNDEYIVGQDLIELNFEVRPSYALNKDISISIIQSISAEGLSENIAYVSGNKIKFMKAGDVTLQIDSLDKNCTKIIKIKYTGGDAIDAQLNVSDTLILNIGESATLGVSKWLPKDLKNNRFSFQEVNSSGKKVIEINSSSKTIKAVNNGETKLIVELSNGIIKEVKVICVNKVRDIEIEENILVSNSEYTLSAVVLPLDATNKTLEYVLESTQFATLQENILHFTKAGTVTVKVRTTDGTNIEKTVYVTSTLGKLAKLTLDKSEISLTKGEVYRIVADKFPLDATDYNIGQKIISQNAYDGISDVISLSEDGQITTLLSGSAVVRVFAYDYEGKEIYVDCTIVVYTPLSVFELLFDRELDNYQNQNTFITGQNEISFDFSPQPVDSVIKEFSCDVSDDSIARVEGKKIIFLQTGRVSITFNCSDLKVTKSKTYSFHYSGDSLIEATLDTSQIQNNLIKLKAGENFKFALEKVMPNDCLNLKFSVKQAEEFRNDPTKPVAKTEDGILYALNGGKYSFTLYVNNLLLGDFVLDVTRDAVGVKVEEGEMIYTSVPFYTIIAQVIKSDSHQNLLGFESLDKNIANVSTDGNVTFLQLGTCQVKIYVLENPSVFKIINVKYTKDLETIAFNQTRDCAYVSQFIDLTVLPTPVDASDFNYTMYIEKEDGIATLMKREEGYRLIGQKSGEVTVVAVVVGQENITASKTFKFFDKITDIKLELDPGDDLNGHGGYRVFGNTFISDKNQLVNTYLMNVNLTPVNLSKNLLVWSSSDEDIATVGDNGLVTFHSTGKVTISVSQIVPYEGANVVSDSYTFNVVDGINVENYNQFKIANTALIKLNKEKKDNYSALILHNDLQIEKEYNPLVFNYNVYGNGRTLDHSKVQNNWKHFVINRDNIIIDNVILRGVAFSDGSQLKDTGNTLIIENCKNILLYNTIIENAESAIRASSSSITLEGCIIRNILVAGMKLARSAKGACAIKIKDCIFTSSFCGIMYVLDKLGIEEESSVILEGEVRFYNWSTLDQLEQGIDLQTILKQANVSFVASEVSRQLRDIAADKGKNYAYNYNGQVYYNFAIFKLSADLPTSRYEGAGNFDKSKLNPSCNYSSLTFGGAINLEVVVVPINITVLSFLSSNPLIKPGDTYVGEAALLAKIKQPCRF